MNQLKLGFLAKIYCFIVLSILITSKSAASERVVIATNFSPITLSESQAFKSRELMPVLLCIFKRLDLAIEVISLPTGRAKIELAKNKIDGLYLVGENEIVEGVRSTPIYLEKWHYYSNFANLSAYPQKRLGVVSGSEAERWLLTNGFQPDMYAVDRKQLLAQFKRNRIDFFVEDRGIINSLSPELMSHQREFIRYTSKMMVFSKQYIATNPHLLTDFNNQVQHCNNKELALNDAEKRQTINFVRDNLAGYFSATAMLEFQDYIKRKSTPLSLADIVKRDNQWQQNHQPILREVLENSVSQYLNEIKQQNPIVGEILLTKVNGELLAATNITTDYWQGDEEKILRLEKQGYYLSGIRYDASTKLFLVNFSSPLYFEYDNDKIALKLILGLNLENLLLSNIAN